MRRSWQNVFFGTSYNFHGEVFLLGTSCDVHGKMFPSEGFLLGTSCDVHGKMFPSGHHMTFMAKFFPHMAQRRHRTRPTGILSVHACSGEPCVKK